MNLQNPLRLVAALLLASASTLAWSQAQEATFDNYVLRSSVVGSMSLPESSASRYNIRRSPDTALINVTLLKKDSQHTQTLPVKLEVHAVGVDGKRRRISMRETKANGWISHMGSFKFTPGETLDFVIRAKPEKSDQPVEMKFQEKLELDTKER